ncbi:MAG: M50 family metallopeptidase [Planctomycetes bacterium]|nr:M50 family metallopeptidase [Planctomycetota bacterium]
MQTSPGRNFELFRVQGIPVRIHRMLLILMGLIVLMAANPTPEGSAASNMLSTFLALTILFATVLMHELGHALVARRVGVQVSEITLWPLGGMAMMQHMPEDSRVESAIASAGPLVNLLCGAVLLGLWIPMEGGWDGSALLDTRVDSLTRAVGFFALCHLALGIFNLLPAFPMDGGKMLRAHLAKTRDWLPATEAAAKVGRNLAWAMLFASIAFGMWGLFFVSVYLFFAGTRELWATRLKHMTGGSNPMEEMLRNMGGRGFPDPSEQPPQEESAPSPSRGFSDEDIARMEAEKGSISKKSQD